MSYVRHQDSHPNCKYIAYPHQHLLDKTTTTVMIPSPSHSFISLLHESSEITQATP